MKQITVAPNGPRFLLAVAVGCSVLVIAPVAASAAFEHHSTAVRGLATPGVIYGGVTPQGYPILLETSRSGNQVVRATIAIRLTCTSGARTSLPDAYTRLSINKKRKFSTSFGPATMRNDDGTTTDIEGAVSGTFNASRTKAAGTWTFKATDHDATGAVTDTCDSGTVTWTAKQ